MSNDLEQYLVQKASAIGTPIKATLELTPLCNMKCKMCYIRHSMNEMQEQGGLKPVSYWKSLISEMKEMGVLFVALIGGEPLTYPGISSIYEELVKNGFYVNLTTNGTLLSESIPMWLKKHPPRYVTVSLYGASDTTYEAVTGNKNGFSQTIAAIKRLLQAKIPVKLNYIEIPENMQDLEAIFALKNYYQLPILATSYCFPQVRKDNVSPGIRFSPRDCAVEELRIRQLNAPEQYENFCHYLASGYFEVNTVKHTNKIYCHAGNSTFWITWQGNMVPCGIMKNISIRAEQNTLQESWSLLKEKISCVQTSPKCAVCRKREVCQVCPAIMEAETGQINGCPDYLCQMTEEMIRYCAENEKYR